ncbi:MAG: hypothetical protein E7J86_21970, partial [Aeromonas caviae]|nr:hypothetical protein [Aeromonas caviae]
EGLCFSVIFPPVYEGVILSRDLIRWPNSLCHYKASLEALMASDSYEPLFISQQGNPYLPKVVDARFGELRRSMVTMGIPFTHRFHDLRCSYATYRLHSLLVAGLDPAEALDLLMQWMGHNHESTTWKYLRYLKRKEALKEKISILDNIMHQALREA